MSATPDYFPTEPTRRRTIRLRRRISGRSISCTSTPASFPPGATPADPNSQSQLDLQSAYARDTIEITRWLQLIAAVRVDRFDETALDLNTRTRRPRVDKLVSPADAVIFKPME